MSFVLQNISHILAKFLRKIRDLLILRGGSGGQVHLIHIAKPLSVTVYICPFRTEKGLKKKTLINILDHIRPKFVKNVEKS